MNGLPERALCAGLLFAALVVVGCASPRGSAYAESESLELPSPAASYSTAARARGIVGGRPAQDLARAIDEQLRARGDDAEPDGALGAVAIWILRESVAGRPIEAMRMEAVSRRYGFAGVLVGSGAFSHPGATPQSYQVRLDLPRNHPVTRYGVVTIGSGTAGAFVVGAVEADLADFPRHLPTGGTIRLQGEVFERFAQATVIVTGSDGVTRELAMPARRVSATLQLDRPGPFRVEIMATGPDGPQIVVNVPVYVGVAEQDPASWSSAPVDPTLTPERVEARLLELVNEARRRNGVGQLIADPPLRAIALAHSLDMSRHDFVGHVSPTTGTPEDRARRAGVIWSLSKLGENVGLAASPEEIHQGLMDSPGHRANLLRRDFTHVGIGVAPVESAGHRLFAATQLFGRRPPADEVRQAPESILEAIQHFRAAKALSTPRVDPVLAAASDAGVRAYLASMQQAQAIRAAEAVLQADAQRRRRARPKGCLNFVEILERAQLADLPLLFDSRLAAIGVGAAVVEKAVPPRLAVMIVAEGTPAASLECK
jgi:uncharacterized protein YkwD